MCRWWLGVELWLGAKEGTLIGPVETLQAWVGLHLDSEFELLTHGYLWRRFCSRLSSSRHLSGKQNA